MTFYSGAVVAPGSVAGYCLADVKANGVSTPSVFETIIYSGIATLNFALGRSASEHLQIGASALQSEEDLAQFSTTTAAVAWSNIPTVPTNVLRRCATGNAGANMIILSFPRGIQIASLGSLGWFNTSATSNAALFSVSWQVNE